MAFIRIGFTIWTTNRIFYVRTAFITLTATFSSAVFYTHLANGAAWTRTIFSTTNFWNYYKIKLTSYVNINGDTIHSSFHTIHIFSVYLAVVYLLIDWADLSSGVEEEPIEIADPKSKKYNNFEYTIIMECL